ncbi:uncharacterized protein BX664DRAFT_341553 [Halteromyces radiatus]|uniref:uncharacterized protein n=1 Tax=Halteromyces radiatus TaxID=101107 RepID=UPI00221E3EC2|nr:uncharacterized protein BX664DRAFT_341553 [Halteromyces radiatus]KAI8079828.1 hypothetical protein BX664DRAFT_341553 [Halteromyces radiatus]
MGIHISKIEHNTTKSNRPTTTTRTSSSIYPYLLKSHTNGNGRRLEYGCLLPQGIYPCASCDYDAKAVRKFIKAGLLAPFFTGLNDPPSLVKQVIPIPQQQNNNDNNDFNDNKTVVRIRNKLKHRLLLLRSSTPWLDQNLDKDTIECPICLLYYPFTNYTRCCGQPICTDCFLQLRRSDESPLDPAACPFCVQPNLGVIHIPPEWSQQYKIFKQQRMDICMLWEPEEDGNTTGKKQRWKKLGPNDRHVVLVDQVRPNWQDQFDLTAQQQQRRSFYEVDQQRRHRRRLSGTMAGSGTTRRIIVRPTIQPTYTASSM